MSEGPKVKICGLTRNADARLADELGANFLGVVASAGFSRSVRQERLAEVVAGTRASRVAVLVDEAPEAAAALARTMGAAVLQLHGDESVAVVRALRSEGDWRLWKAVRAQSLEDVSRAVDRFADCVDGLLVEGWRDGVIGGAGARLALDPDSVRSAIPTHLDFVLAGGLTPESVSVSVSRFRPDIVDVSSGIEGSIGVKDAILMRTFLASVRIPTDVPRQEP